MIDHFSRRALLGGFAGAAAAASLGKSTFVPRARAGTGLALVAERRVIEVNGKAASVFGLRGPDGRQGLTLEPGARFAVELANRTDRPTIVHWHGQLPDWRQDGVAWADLPPLAAGTTRGYDFAPVTGTYWMHSHQGLQEQALMAAPLIVRSAEDARLDAQEVVLFLHDFSFTPPAMLLAKLRRPAAPMGEMQGLADMAEMSGMPKMSGMGGMDLNDVDFDAFLANDRTLADPEVTRVEAGGHIRLRVINGASGTNFWLDLGALRGMLIATDGVPVKPVTGSRFPIAMAQRLDILVRLPGAGAFPVLALREGDTARAGIVLATPGASVARLASRGATIAPAVDNSLEMRLAAGTPLSPRPVDRRIAVTLSGSMQPYVWMMNSQSWPTITPLRVAKGDRVEITMTNMSMMVHPMHLHGHRFQVVAMNGKPLSGAVRDTVLVEPKSAVTIAFDANNPGRWLFHCHNLYHMASGMMSMIAYDGISVPTLMPA